MLGFSAVARACEDAVMSRIGRRARASLDALRQRRERADWSARGVVIEDGARVPAGSRLVAREVVIRHHAMINGPMTAKGHGRVEIGARCAVGEGLTVVTSTHLTNHPNMQLSLHRELGFVPLDRHADVTIGPGCWVGDRVILLEGVSVGAGAVLAAGSLVRRDVAPYTVVGGVPARVIGARCPPDVAHALAESGWWDWPRPVQARRRAFFEMDITTATADDVQAASRI